MWNHSGSITYVFINMGVLLSMKVGDLVQCNGSSPQIGIIIKTINPQAEVGFIPPLYRVAWTAGHATTVYFASDIEVISAAR